jgi:hypothetical protein
MRGPSEVVFVLNCSCEIRAILSHFLINPQLGLLAKKTRYLTVQNRLIWTAAAKDMLQFGLE